MSAAIRTEHRKLVALRDDVKELRRLCADAEGVRQQGDISERRWPTQRRSAYEKVGQLFAGENFVP